MTELITRIHPDLPLCWEDPDTLRIGFERARGRVLRPSAGAQRFIGRLITGFPAETVDVEARRAGIPIGQARALLHRLRGALDVGPATARTPPTPRPLRTLISDDGREPPGLREALEATGLCDLDGVGRGAPDLVIHVERFREPLERAQRWLIEGTPHLLVRFTDGAVQVGPLVTGEGSPCHSCATLSLLRRDAAYPVLAAQLSGRTPRSESVASSHMAAAYAETLIREWLDGGDAARTRRFSIPVARGRVDGTASSTSIAPHPECACSSPASATNREGCRLDRAPPSTPESRSTSRARVKAT